MNTTEEREQAFILMFEQIFNPDIECEKIIQIALDNEVITNSKYTQKLFTEACNKMPVIDELIKQYVKDRAFERISKVSLAVLRLAVCEIRYFEKVPTGVSINEAVNLCKKYASEDEYSFVNGVLGALAKGIEQ